MQTPLKRERLLHFACREAHHVLQNIQHMLQLSNMYITLIISTGRPGKLGSTIWKSLEPKMNGWETGHVWTGFGEVWAAAAIKSGWSKAISRVKVYLYFQGISSFSQQSYKFLFQFQETLWWIFNSQDSCINYNKSLLTLKPRDFLAIPKCTVYYMITIKNFNFYQKNVKF